MPNDVINNHRSNVNLYDKVTKDERWRLIQAAGYGVASLSKEVSTPVAVLERWLASDDPVAEFRNEGPDLKVKAEFLEIIARQQAVESNAEQLRKDQTRKQALENLVVAEVARLDTERHGQHVDSALEAGQAVKAGDK